MVTSNKVLALDLERTLIDDALRGSPRPGLEDFFAFCEERFRRIVIFTTVEESDARQVLSGLSDAGYLSASLHSRLEYIDWTGEYKDLRFIPGVPPADVIFVDDDCGWIRPDQRNQWVKILAWDGGPDTELSRIRLILESC